jgi:hypothetical protein
MAEDCCDPADHLSVPVGGEEARFRFLESGVLSGGERVQLIHDERGNPVGIAMVERPGKTDEALQVSAGIDCRNCNAHTILPHERS